MVSLDKGTVESVRYAPQGRGETVTVSRNEGTGAVAIAIASVTGASVVTWAAEVGASDWHRVVSTKNGGRKGDTRVASASRLTRRYVHEKWVGDDMREAIIGAVADGNSLLGITEGGESDAADLIG